MTLCYSFLLRENYCINGRIVNPSGLSVASSSKENYRVRKAGIINLKEITVQMEEL